MKRFAVLGLLLAAVAMMIVACTPPAAPAVPAPAQGAAEAEKAAEVTPAPEIKPAEEVTLAVTPQPDEMKALLMSVDRDECFVPNQFIMYGDTDCIERVNKMSEMKGLEPLLLKEIVLQNPNALTNALKGVCESPLALNQFRDDADNTLRLVMRLYQSGGGDRAAEAISKARKATIDLGCRSIAEPNYLIGKPWIPVGSPDQGGPIEAPAGSFWSQPALQTIGLATPVTTGGTGVRVGIFDTLPASFDAVPGTPKIIQVGSAATGHQITLQALSRVPSVIVTPTSDAARDHGVFVAGLVKAVAPEADVKLYQVLDESAVGDIFTLMEALKDFICSGQPDHSVVNLSLGLHWYDEGYLFSLLPEDAGVLAGELDAATISQDLRDGFEASNHSLTLGATVTAKEAGSRWRIDDSDKQYFVRMELGRLLVFKAVATPSDLPKTCTPPDPDFATIFTLQDLLDAANELGVMVVAAAGNNATGMAKQADIPARWPNTIGVAASGPGGTGLACFSNAGDVLAPGGEGLKGQSSEECKPPFADCDPSEVCNLNDDCKTPGDVNCDPTVECACYCLVSLGTQKTNTGLLYWAGTSFSTPLVSGLAARLIAERGGNTAGAQLVTKVGDWISCGSTNTSTGFPAPHAIDVIKALDSGSCQ